MQPTYPTPAVSEKLARYLDAEGRLKGWSLAGWPAVLEAAAGLIPRTLSG